MSINSEQSADPHSIPPDGQHSPNEPGRNAASSPAGSRSAGEIRDWLVRQLADELKLPISSVSADQPILSSGIDSMQIVGLVTKLEDWLGIRFAENPLDDHPTVDMLAQHVAKLSVAQRVTLTS